MDGKVGYIDTKGNYIIPAKYKDGTHFYEDLAFVVADGENITCIDKKGNTKFVLKKVDYAEPFSEGLAIVGVKGHGCGFINKKGEFVINPQFESAKPFREGLAAVRQNDKWGFIDNTGKMIINPQFEHVSSFYDSKALFYDGKQWGFINKKGEYDINPQFASAAIFSEGLSAIQQGNQAGYINEKGQIVVNPQFDYAGDFNSGLSVIKQNSKYGYINKKGQIVINPQFYFASQFFGDVAFVMDANARWGIIDKKGKYLVNPQFDDMKFRIADIDDQWVQTDYYDITEFVNAFFNEKAIWNYKSFLGKTLQDLIDNETYGDYINAKAYTELGKNFNGIGNVIGCKKRIDIMDDVVLECIDFTSINKFYTTYNYYSKKYDFDAEINGVLYEFSLKNELENKEESFGLNFKQYVKEIFNLTEYETDYGGFYGYNESQKLYVFVTAEHNKCWLFVMNKSLQEYEDVIDVEEEDLNVDDWE